MWQAEQRPLTVTEVTEAIAEVVATEFPRLSVEGEVSNFKRHASGHLYFTLKDERARLSGVCWRSTAERLRAEVRDGMRIIVTGRLAIYAAFGQYQIVADAIADAGEGALQRAFLELKARLHSEGLFDAERKRPLPAFPMKIVVITSPSGAAVRDIISTLERRWPCAEVIMAGVHVQGESAAAEIEAALDLAGRVPNADVVIVGRGGGSLEDLQAFNSERVARAVARCRIPVVSAVGHETDVTICDFVSDRRAATPTGAAEMVVPDRAELVAGLDVLARRSRQRMRDRIAFERRRLSENLRSYALGRVRGRIETAMQQCDYLGDTMRRSITARFSRASILQGALEQRLRSLDPSAVLARGYTLCEDAESGALLCSAQAAGGASTLRTRFHDGNVVSDVRRNAR